MLEGFFLRVPLPVCFAIARFAVGLFVGFVAGLLTSLLPVFEAVFVVGFVARLLVGFAAVLLAGFVTGFFFSTVFIVTTFSVSSALHMYQLAIDR